MLLYSKFAFMKLRRFILMFVAVWIAAMAPRLHAQDGLRGAWARLGASTNLLQTLFEQRLVAADFDNDQRPDGAVLVNAGRTDGQKTFRIEFHVTARENSEFTFGSDESELTISVLDVNSDGAPDIVLRQAVTQKVLEVWMNDGRGSFRMARAEELGLVSNQGPCQLSTSLQIEDCPVFSLNSRTSVESAGLRAGEISLAFPASSMGAWPQWVGLDSATAASIPVRGPPRSLSL